MNIISINLTADHAAGILLPAADHAAAVVLPAAVLLLAADHAAGVLLAAADHAAAVLLAADDHAAAFQYPAADLLAPLHWLCCGISKFASRRAKKGLGIKGKSYLDPRCASGDSDDHFQCS